MTISDLDQEFRSLTGEPLDLAAVRDSIAHGVSRYHRRRRIAALVASAAAVVVVAASIGVVRGMNMSASQAAAAADWQQHVRPVVIPAGSTMVPYTMRAVVSPVTATVDAPGASDAVTWVQDVDTLFVAWQYTPGTSTATRVTGPFLPDPSTNQRGYVITPAAQLPRWQAAPGADGTTVTPSTTPERTQAPVATVINGHPAVIADDPQSAFTVNTGQTRWISWQLSDGRWLHAWVRTGGDAALIAFAKGIVEKPTTITRHLAVGVTAPGYTVEATIEIGTADSLAGAEVSLCRVGTPTVYATSESQPCLTAMLIPTKDLGNDLKGTITTVTVDGVTTHINKTTYESFADIGNGYSILVGYDVSHPISDLDIATLAASVRIHPTIKLGP